MKQTIALVGEKRLYMTMLNRLISSIAELSLVRVYDTPADAIGLLSHPTDIIMIDIGDAEDPHVAFELVRKLHLMPAVLCIVCTMHTNDQVIRRSFEAGASGFIKLDSPYDEISQIFRVIVKRGAPVSDFVTKRLIAFMHGQENHSASNSTLEKNSTKIVNKACKMIDAYFVDPRTAAQQKMSEYLIRSLHISYGYLSALFHEEKGISLRDYVIRKKIEKVKMMMRDENLTLTKIANKLDYSSVAHLSSQFRKVVGINPSTYKSRMLVFGDAKEIQRKS